MSSIAYITDQEMIEYHRLHGNTKIVFWRPSGQKHFQRFAIGDYLFFLTKGTEKGKKREKGIVGYGRYVKEDMQTCKQVWKKYGALCGYGDENQFQNAVVRISKTHELPKKMHCLLLENVIFFQAPIYLSEFDKTISKQIESYIYLDQEQQVLGWDILNQAMAIGTDMWSTFVENQNVYIQQDADMIIVQNIHQQIACEWYNAYESKKITNFVNKLCTGKTSYFLSGSTDDFMYMDKHQVYFGIPCVLSLKNWKRNLLFDIAKAHLYQGALKEKQSSAKVLIVFDEPYEPAERLCEIAGVSYKIMNYHQ